MIKLVILFNPYDLSLDVQNEQSDASHTRDHAKR